MHLSLMIEGQEGVTWDDWVRLARLTEESGLEGLFRSDHYTAIIRPDAEAHDAWATLAGLAALTERIRLGTMVSPATFRAAQANPNVTLLVSDFLAYTPHDWIDPVDGSQSTLQFEAVLLQGTATLSTEPDEVAS